MGNHPNRSRAADRRAVERLVKAADTYRKVEARNAARAARNGMIGPSDTQKEFAAQDAYLEACETALARFAPEQS